MATEAGGKRFLMPTKNKITNSNLIKVGMDVKYTVVKRVVKIDILDIIEELYNVENSNIFIENYLKNETMFDEENPVNKRVRAMNNTFSQYGEKLSTK